MTKPEEINTSNLGYSTINRKTLIITLMFMIIVMTFTFWYGRDRDFQIDSEGLVVSMINAGKYNLDIGDSQYGLRRLHTIGTNNPYEDPYEIYYNEEGIQNGYVLYDYKSQIGLHGWISYYVAQHMPYPLQALRFGCCLLLSIVLSLISLELFKKFGLLMAICFFGVSLTSSLIKNFSTNLYWLEFTWYVPMLFGLLCLNNLNRHYFFYPLIYIAVLIKCASGYEFISVIMLSSVMFLIVEWLSVIKKDKQKSKKSIIAILFIGIASLLAFLTAVFIHSWIRGQGNIADGLLAIYENDVLRRTFGNATDFGVVYTASLNASVIDVLYRYLWLGKAGKLAISALLSASFVIVYKSLVGHKFLRTDFWLLTISFVTCISWFIVGKSHSYIHTNLNIVMWYMGFMQISVYIVLKFALHKLYTSGYLQKINKILRSEINYEI